MIVIYNRKMEIEIIEQKILSIEDIRHEINYRTNRINQEILRINKKFTDDT